MSSGVILDFFQNVISRSPCSEFLIMAPKVSTEISSENFLNVLEFQQILLQELFQKFLLRLPAVSLGVS